MSEETLVVEQSHRLEATYIDETGKKKRGQFRATAKNKSDAVNKVGVALSQRHYKNIDVKHVGLEESVVEEIDESKTYRADPDEKPSFANRVRNMKKKMDKEAHDRSEDKRHVDEDETEEVEIETVAEEELVEKDIGKKGKNFDKIADKADKEYGSKEAGDRVAGAILAKLRAKHPRKYSAKVAKEK